MIAFGVGPAHGFGGMRLTEYGFGCDGADPTGALRGGARAASSIQPVALLFKSWIWAKPALRPITRKGRPAGKPYNTGAEEDGLASRYRYMDELHNFWPLLPVRGSAECGLSAASAPLLGAQAASNGVHNPAANAHIGISGSG